MSFWNSRNSASKMIKRNDIQQQRIWQPPGIVGTAGCCHYCRGNSSLNEPLTKVGIDGDLSQKHLGTQKTRHCVHGLFYGQNGQSKVKYYGINELNRVSS